MLDTISVTCSIPETAMTAVTIFRSPNVTAEITCDNNSVFWRHLCCLLIKQGPKLVLDSLGAACLRSARREELYMFSGDNDLHQAVTETFHACNRISEAFRDDHTNTVGGPGTAAQNGLKASAYVPRLATGPPRLLYRTQVDSSSLQRFYQLARAARQRTHIQRSYAGPAYVTGLPN